MSPKYSRAIFLGRRRYSTVRNTSSTAVKYSNVNTSRQKELELQVEHGEPRPSPHGANSLYSQTPNHWSTPCRTHDTWHLICGASTASVIDQLPFGSLTVRSNLALNDELVGVNDRAIVSSSAHHYNIVTVLHTQSYTVIDTLNTRR